MEIAPIKTKRDYRRTLKEIEGLMTARRHTPDRRWRVGPTCLTRYSNAPRRIALDRIHKTMARRYEKPETL